MPSQPFKADFIEGMKILGRQRPIKHFVDGFRGRLREIGGDIGKNLDDNLLSDTGDGEDSKK